jgi:transposase
MGEVSTIGLDLAKNVFQVHGADASGAVLFRKKLRRHQLPAFFSAQPPCTVAMEACSRTLVRNSDESRIQPLTLKFRRGAGSWACQGGS